MQKLIIIILSFFINTNSFAQITTSGIKGNVTATDKKLLSNATIQAVLETTGEKYTAITQANGNFILTNMKSGGPYTIITSYSGYKADTLQNVYLSLGKYFTTDVQLLSKNALLTEVVVSANGKKKISFGNNINSTQLAQMPTLNRSLQNYCRWLVP